MKKLLLLSVLVGLMFAGFLVGRVTAPAPLYQPAALDGKDPLGAAFEDFLRAQENTIALFRDSAFFDGEQAQAEAYRGFLYSLIGSIKAAALQSHDHPRFMRAVDWTSKSGLDNPDNNYYIAMIHDDADYRIIGNRGSTASLVFQLVIGQPGVRGAGTSDNVSVLYDRDIITDEDGAFEIIVSRQDPGPGINWLANGEGAETLLVRFTHSDWSGERDSRLLIEKIGEEGKPAPLLTPQSMAQGLRDAAVSLYDRNATWLQYAERAWTLMPRNGISPARPSRGGLVGQYSAFGSWELAQDQALILSTAPSEADYQGIELGNLWFVSLDYETRTSSLTLDQMHCSGDRRCYAVVSHRDPGIQNWLDTEGHPRGLIMMRWQGLDAALPEALQPDAKRVPFSDIRAHLPADVPVFSPAQRANQIRTRRAAVHHRFGG
jgi:hypothetical protein